MITPEPLIQWTHAETVLYPKDLWHISDIGYKSECLDGYVLVDWSYVMTYFLCYGYVSIVMARTFDILEFSGLRRDSLDFSHLRHTDLSHLRSLWNRGRHVRLHWSSQGLRVYSFRLPLVLRRTHTDQQTCSPGRDQEALPKTWLAKRGTHN